jgi:AraC-like DNA-binding protein
MLQSRRSPGGVSLSGVEAPDVASGFLVVRASGAAAAKAAITGGRSAPEQIQLLMRCSVPAVPRAGRAELAYAGCTLHVRQGVVMLTVPAAKLSIGFGELRPLMFQPVQVDAALRNVFASAIAHVLAAGDALDPHGVEHHLRGLAELALRSALRTELNRVDALAARRREALEYIRANLADPELGADQIANALFISRRRLYQLFDDGQGVSERIRAMRLDHAKALLADPAKGARGIGEISKACGFISPAHFSRTFRKAVGQSPREFRERAR